MPDLGVRTIRSWLVEEEMVDPWSELPEAARRAELEPGIEAAVVALGIALDETEKKNPNRLFDIGRTDPPRTAFQSVLSQLGRDRLLRLLDWLTEPGKPDRQALLTALIAPERGGASREIQRAVRYATRRALLGRLHADARLSSLVICAVPSRRELEARRNTL